MNHTAIIDFHSQTHKAFGLMSQKTSIHLHGCYSIHIAAIQYLYTNITYVWKRKEAEARKSRETYRSFDPSRFLSLSRSNNI